MTGHLDVGSDHCRVVPALDEASILEQIQYYRHLFAYSTVENLVNQPTRVLEIGSGEGYGGDYLSSRIPWLVMADLSMVTLRHTLATYPQCDNLCQLVATELPFIDDTFDAVISFQVIEHIEDVFDYLREIKRVLRPGGKVILTTPNRKYRLLPFQKPWNPYHIREYYCNELVAEISNVFPKVDTYGVLASEYLMNIELERVRQDPFLVYGGEAGRILGRMLPNSMRDAVGFAKDLVQRTAKGMSHVVHDFVIGDRKPQTMIQQNVVNKSSIGIDSFQLTKACDLGLDLLAVGHK